MFSFHKPKVYRSPTGCCICKAKSSSSRFTDSAKYEEDFLECFLLQERRHGEICNACVLLVKRWKKLPPGSNRNWQHVVDARAGPGIKSLTKFKAQNKKKPTETVEKVEKIVKKKHVYVKSERYRGSSPAISNYLDATVYLTEESSKVSRSADSPAGSDIRAVPRNNFWQQPTYFTREDICCGGTFNGPDGSVILMRRIPCMSCMPAQPERAQPERLMNALGNSPAHSSASASPAHSVDSTSSGSEVVKPLGKGFSDSSSDSGYDEASNQGIGESKIGKTNQSIYQQQQRQKIDKLMCKALELAVTPIGNLSLSSSTSRPIVANIANNPLIDLAIHASTRESINN